MVAASNPRIDLIREAELIMARMAANAPERAGYAADALIDDIGKISLERAIVLSAYCLGAIAGMQFAVGGSLQTIAPQELLNQPMDRFERIVRGCREYLQTMGIPLDA